MVKKKKAKKKNTDQVRRSNVSHQASKLLKFRSSGTSVRVNNLYGNRPMTVSDRMNDWKISYVMTTHAIERMNERAMYETDIRNTLAFGASFRRYQEERDTYVYVYEYRCFRVVVDRDVTVDTDEVVVITATYSKEFNELVSRCSDVFYTSEWRLSRGLRLVYDEIGSVAFSERSFERVKSLMRNRGYIEHNYYTLKLEEKKVGFDFRKQLGDRYFDYMRLVTTFNIGYGTFRDDMFARKFDGLCEYVGDSYVHLCVGGRDYILDTNLLCEKKLTLSDVEVILKDARNATYLTDRMYALSCGYRYNVTLGYCSTVTFIYDIEEVPEYAKEFAKYSKYSIDPEELRDSFDEYVADKGFGIYGNTFYKYNVADLSNIARVKNLKAMEALVISQKQVFDKMKVRIG